MPSFLTSNLQDSLWTHPLVVQSDLAVGAAGSVRRARLATACLFAFGLHYVYIASYAGPHKVCREC